MAQQNPQSGTLPAPVVRGGSPAVMWVETAGVTLLALAFGFWVRPADPFFLGSGFPWLVFAPALIALSYGFVPGIVSASLLIAAWMLAQRQGFVPGEFPKLHFLGTLILVMV